MKKEPAIDIIFCSGICSLLRILLQHPPVLNFFSSCFTIFLSATHYIRFTSYQRKTADPSELSVYYETGLAMLLSAPLAY